MQSCSSSTFALSPPTSGYKGRRLDSVIDIKEAAHFKNGSSIINIFNYDPGLAKLEADLLQKMSIIDQKPKTNLGIYTIDNEQHT